MAWYGLLARFADTESLISAAERVRAAGYERVDAYAPFIVEGLAEALGFHKTRLPRLVLIGGLMGMSGGFALQWWISVWAYPLNIGGRPLNSWPAFIPVTFELTILVAALFAVLGMLGLNGLPQPHHPLFGVPDFDRASSDSYFLCIEAADPRFDRESTRLLLESLNAAEVIDVPRSA